MTKKIVKYSKTCIPRLADKCFPILQAMQVKVKHLAQVLLLCHLKIVLALHHLALFTGSAPYGSLESVYN